MLNTPRAYGGMATAPHHLAAQAGAAALREGANAAEAMLAMAAAIAVVYPHMNSIGGDGFWLAAAPGEAPVAIQACGPAARRATPGFYAEKGLAEIPSRGPLAALTVPGTIGGWRRAFELSRRWGGRMPLADLLAEAIRHGRDGIAVCASQARLTREKLPGIEDVPGFAATYLDDGRVPAEGARLRQPALADTLGQLGRAGLDDFYRGDIARALAGDLEAAGSPLALDDLQAYDASFVEPLSVSLSGARAYNLPPPTQGASALAILAILDRQGRPGRPVVDDFVLVHKIVEATKQAFILRDAEIRDPTTMRLPAADLVADAAIARMAAAADSDEALPWPHKPHPGDTIWMGAVDGEGRAVSFIQSLYWEFGSGLVSRRTGILLQNRGISFPLADGHPNRLAPGRLPFHTLNPALARFDDGRVMVYGTMGGEGQPQTQAAVFARYAWGGMGLQAAVTAPRWLLGRTWGEATTTLKLERLLYESVGTALMLTGHDVEGVDDFSDLMGHAGAIVRHADGLLEGAADPRSDGAVAAL
ncbi:MAG TPA: gamma-glutamyltransferase [Afifellaceae bacterium]|nr:gamma-glutamyltransferase [Afifellaceae bacterium]